MAIYMIWFLATAAMIVTVLTIGTLAAADLLPDRRRPQTKETSDRTERVPPGDVARGEADAYRHRNERRAQPDDRGVPGND